MLRIFGVFLLIGALSACSQAPTSQQLSVENSYDSATIRNNGLVIPTDSLDLYRQYNGDRNKYQQTCEQDEKKVCSSRWVDNVEKWYNVLQNGIYSRNDIKEMRETQETRHPEIK